MDTNTRQLAALVAQTFERFEAAVLTCLPADKRREVVLSPAWIEFRLALGKISSKPETLPAPVRLTHGELGPKVREILEALGARVTVKFREHSTMLVMQGPVEIEEGRSGRIGNDNNAYLTIYRNGNHQWQGEPVVIEWACEPLEHLGLGSKTKG